MHFALALGFIAALLLTLAAVDFARRLASTTDAAHAPSQAVVFTGQFDRVHAGLALLQARRVDRLLISGVNPGAGIKIEQFADQFGLNAGLRRALKSGRLVLGPSAQHTAANAVETACWNKAQKLSGPLLLITSRSHMPRASLALERALPGHDVQRMSLPATSANSPSGQPSLNILRLEFLKFVATTLSQPSPWLVAAPTACAATPP